ncbi:MAG TPA: glycerol-3-phosphate 1-O-acyltransferase PlsY [Candidatus Cloacimonadota bacterium]|nr:glycerol-3-phosphate 1-O-acyltransferase PlsY [Candidatus Cloacimonadota bacterium]
MNLLRLLVCFLGAYLIGSIPVGYIIGKIFFHKDIRTAGSGNIGATNALRLFGTKVGIGILLLDMLKGFGVILLARLILGTQSPWVVVCGLTVILGHVFTIFLRFKGGKGVATAGGVFLAMAPVALLLTLLSFILITAITRYVSLGSILGALGFGVMVTFQQLSLPQPSWLFMVMAYAIIIMIVVKHRDNIVRLMKGTENKISFTKKGSV